MSVSNWSTKGPKTRNPGERASWEAERLGAPIQERTRREAVDAQSALESTWRHYRMKADNPLGSRWTPGDLMAFERALVGLGLRGPFGGKAKG